MNRRTPPDHPADIFSNERMLDRCGKRDQPEYWSASSARGMVATAHYRATAVGARVLADGGNAFDAAVAASFALGVCEPAGSGVGGMSVALIHDASQDRTIVLDGACVAPADATPDAVTGAGDRYRGYQAVAVPTQLAVLDHLVNRYGSVKPEILLAPAIALAEGDVPVSPGQHELLMRYEDALRGGNAAAMFSDEQGALLRPGSALRLRALATTLRRLSTHGLDDFYRGGIAQEIAADMAAHGGFVTARDLARGGLCRECEPLVLRLGDATVCGAGPPAGGLALLQMLNISSRLAPSLDPDTLEGAVLTAAIIRQTRRDRRVYRLDTGAREPLAASELLTSAYADRAAAVIRSEVTALPVDRPDGAASSAPQGETSHISVMDDLGNAVALTQSIERSFGAAVATPALGFLYNGYLRAFKVRNRRHPHYLRPGVPARSNAAPTLVFRDGRPCVSIGSTGSERMASGIFQVLVRLARQSPFEAVHAPRLHCTPEGQVWVEADRTADEVLEALRRHGFALNPIEPYAFAMGGLQLVVRRGETLCGVGEPRRDSAAAGPEMVDRDGGV